MSAGLCGFRFGGWGSRRHRRAGICGGEAHDNRPEGELQEQVQGYDGGAVTGSLQQVAEKVALLTRPAQARRDAPRPMRCSRIAQGLNVPKRTSRLLGRCGLAERPFCASCEGSYFGPDLLVIEFPLCRNSFSTACQGSG